MRREKRDAKEERGRGRERGETERREAREVRGARRERREARAVRGARRERREAKVDSREVTERREVKGKRGEVRHANTVTTAFHHIPRSHMGGACVGTRLVPAPAFQCHLMLTRRVDGTCSRTRREALSGT